MSQLTPELENYKQSGKELGERRYYLDKGSELTDYYCPSGFRFLTNTDWIDKYGYAEQCAIDIIRNCWKFYDSVAVGPAFDINGFMMHDMIAIYVKRAQSVRLGNVCDCCGESYEDKDIVHVEIYFRERIKECKNCFNFYSFEEIKVGNDVVLVRRCQY